MVKRKKVIVKRGALSRQLGIDIKDNIPITLLKKISNSRTGSNIRNPTQTGNKTIPVTRLIKKRSIMAFAAKKIRSIK
jgi:hypothetical protein